MNGNHRSCQSRNGSSFFRLFAPLEKSRCSWMISALADCTNMFSKKTRVADKIDQLLLHYATCQQQQQGWAHHGRSGLQSSWKRISCWTKQNRYGKHGRRHRTLHNNKLERKGSTNGVGLMFHDQREPAGSWRFSRTRTQSLTPCQHTEHKGPPKYHLEATTRFRYASAVWAMETVSYASWRKRPWEWGSLRKMVDGPTNREQGRCARSAESLLSSGSARPMAIITIAYAAQGGVRRGMTTAWSISIHNQTCELSLKGLRSSSVIRASSRADCPQWGTSKVSSISFYNTWR